MNSKFQYLWILHADNCFMTKDYLLSLEAVREAQRVGPYRALMSGLEAANLSLLSRDQECFDFCDREIKLSPGIAALYYFRGISGHKLHMARRQVIADLEKAVQLAPDEVNYANALHRVSGVNSGLGKH
ncbi:MAG: hypothetical protein JNN26_19470 [Candidatus Obscuribacter sp.]|nr:hypothetical protein [Candidatus Obscuribacter sp.]